jgi:hypothetical protein
VVLSRGIAFVFGDYAGGETWHCSLSDGEGKEPRRRRYAVTCKRRDGDVEIRLVSPRVQASSSWLSATDRRARVRGACFASYLSVTYERGGASAS